MKKGQSLVEFAIILPILLLFLLGVLEIGIAIRNYLVIVNANREATRFAVRPNYLDVNAKDYNDIGYQEVFTHANDAVGNTVLMDFVRNSKMIINIIEIDTGFPCDPDLREPTKHYRRDLENGDWFEVPESAVFSPENNWPKFRVDIWPNCVCDQLIPPYIPYVITNSLNSPSHFWALPLDTETQLDIETISLGLAQNNDIHNCIAIKNGTNPSLLTTIAVETFFEHEQYFGIFSTPLTDPIPMYTHTIMRKTEIRKSPYTESLYGN